MLSNIMAEPNDRICHTLNDVATFGSFRGLQTASFISFSGSTAKAQKANDLQQEAVDAGRLSRLLGLINLL
jgi:hypothetical protein